MVTPRLRLGERLLWRCGAFVVLVVLTALAFAGEGDDDDFSTTHRFLSNATKSDEDDDDCPKKIGWGLTVLWIVVVLYMFLGIAVVCDELFVPALEIVADKWDLSDDVSGATLMAAGGSAPELATSLIGTFSRSEVGFGTIVGSAVFNVLFVIAMCAVFTPKHLAPLKLTWWPLARDCTYYIITLACLGIWFAVTTPGKVTTWEAAAQFALYLGYVAFMSKNEVVERAVKTWLGSPLDDDDDVYHHDQQRDDEDIAAELGVVGDTKTTEMSRPSMTRPSLSPTTAAAGLHQQPKRLSSAVSNASSKNASSKKRSTTGFRAGIGRLVLGQGDLSSAQLAGMGVVTQISGDVDATFAQLDHENRGFLDTKDLKQLLIDLGCETDDIDGLRRQLDSNNDGSIDKTEFKVWYIQSEARLKAEVRRVFELFDVNRDGLVEVSEIESVLQALSSQTSRDQARAALATFPHAEGGVTFDQFQTWYESTMFWQTHKRDAVSATKSLLSTVLDATQRVFRCQPSLPPPDPEDVARPSNGSYSDDGGASGDGLSLISRVGVFLTLPLNLALALTVPDCRVPGREHHCYLTFAMSIAWIGIFSYTMVTGIEFIGVQVGVPDFLMGLIFLAAGTSVPDLLSSVVVAKQGKGDMAVSSSIGSNIFDVSVGLPLPWLLFTIFLADPVDVSGKVFLSIAILLAMVLLVILAIALSSWEMSLKLGFFMFALYILYIAQEIARSKFGDC